MSQKFCYKCGMALSENVAVCPRCGTPVQGMKQDDVNSPYPPPIPRQVPSSINVSLSKGENVVRQYLCSNIIRPVRCQGYLTVTNKRVLFEGTSVTSRITQETSIDGISGINSYYGMDIRIRDIIIGILLAILGVFAISFSQNNQLFLLPGLILMGIGGYMIYLAFQKCFILTVVSSKCEGTGISVGTAPGSVLGNGALYSMSGRPTSDTDRMLSEIGSLIQDIQAEGDHAAERWRIEV